VIAVPDPIPLEQPPGRLGALEDVVEDVAGAAYWLTVLSSDLAGPAASAPGWLGDDAAAAAAQVGVVAGIARRCSAAVGAAASRLRRHHDLLRDVRRQVEALQQEQREDFASAWRRLSAIENPRLAAMVDAPERVAIIEELRSAEARRRRRHTALLEEVAQDAVATAGVLGESSAVVGGRGARGDGEWVLAYLAAELPGWGDRELAFRGGALARELFGESLTPEEMNSLARGAASLAQSPEFARALLVQLGEEGVGLLLNSLGTNWLGAGSPVANLLATAFGAAASGDGQRPVDAVLVATFIHSDDRYGAAGHVAAGMAAVLAAGASATRGGVRPVTVAEWARQMLKHEHAAGPGAGIGMVPPDWPAETLDPPALAMNILADRASAGVAASLLEGRDVWQALLNRSWGDGGAALREVVEQAARDDTGAGARAVRTGLEAVGAGLFEALPAHWTVSRDTVAAVSPALAAAVAEQVTVVTSVLGLGLVGDLSGRAGDLVHGLGYLTLDEEVVRTVGGALDDWVRAQPAVTDVACDPIPPPVVVVPSAFLAVREYGQRLGHALHGYEQMAEALGKQTIWDYTFGLPSNVPFVHPGYTVGEGYAAMLLGVGQWDNGPDTGLHFDRDDAADAVRALGPGDRAVAGALADQAREVFDRTSEALGRPRPPQPPDLDELGPLRDAALGFARDTVVKAGWNAGRAVVGPLMHELD
jgi:hypothetical protein